jgi:hypothetical protein
VEGVRLTLEAQKKQGKIIKFSGQHNLHAESNKIGYMFWIN